MSKIPIEQVLNGSLDRLMTLSNVADKLVREHAQYNTPDDHIYEVSYFYSDVIEFVDLKTVETELLNLLTYRYDKNAEFELEGWLVWKDKETNESLFQLTFYFYSFICRFSLPELEDPIVNPFPVIYDFRQPVESILEEYTEAVKFYLNNKSQIQL